MPANQRRVRMPVCWGKRCKADKEEDAKIMKAQCIIFCMCTVYIYNIFWYVYVWIIRVLLGVHSDTRPLAALCHWSLFQVCFEPMVNNLLNDTSRCYSRLVDFNWLSQPYLIDGFYCGDGDTFQHIPSLCRKSCIPVQPMHCNFPTWIWPKKRFLVRGLWVAPCCSSWVTSLVV